MIEEIDSDHARIIELINNLEMLVSTGSGSSPIMEILSTIIDEFEHHFENEACLMNSARYAHRDEHISIHGVLFDKLSRFVYLLETGDSGVDRLILEFLNSWINFHVVEYDKKLAQTLLRR